MFRTTWTDDAHSEWMAQLPVIVQGKPTDECTFSDPTRAIMLSGSRLSHYFVGVRQIGRKGRRAKYRQRRRAGLPSRLPRGEAGRQNRNWPLLQKRHPTVLG